MNIFSSSLFDNDNNCNSNSSGNITFDVEYNISLCSSILLTTFLSKVNLSLETLITSYICS